MRGLLKEPVWPVSSAFFFASARIASLASCLALISSLNNSKFDFFFAAVFGFGFSDDLAVGDGMAGYLVLLAIRVKVKRPSR